MIDQKEKNIGDYKLLKLSADYLTNEGKDLIEALEIIQNAKNIDDLEPGMIVTPLVILLKAYDDRLFRRIIIAKRYQYSTVCSLDMYLKVLHIYGDPIKVFKDYAHLV